MPAVARLTRLFARRVGAGEEDPFDPALFSRLDRMRLRFARAHGARAGETLVRGLTQESGIEVESFKSYAPGDDIRYVDWNAVGRLDQLLTRRFVAEREIPIHVLIDASASMAVPAADRKFAFAMRLAAALAYVALNSNDPVRIAAMWMGRGGAQLDESALLRHRGRYLRLKPFFDGLRPSGATALAEGVARYLERHHERGLAFVVSDFLVLPDVYEQAFARLRAKRLEAHAVHVVGKIEHGLDGVHGRLLIRDVETGAAREVALSAADRRRYAAAFEERVEAIRALCHRSGVGYVRVSSDDGIDHCMTQVLPAAGMMRLR
jgi:uncharacterized protein (DUF58 family)